MSTLSCRLPLLAVAATLAASIVCAQAVQPTADSPRAHGWKMTTLVKGMDHPWGMAFLPDGNILVTERPGRLRLIQNGKLLPQQISGVPEVFARGQGGLMDIALHPNFQQNHFVYLTYSSGSAAGNRTTLARGVLDGTALRDTKEIYRVRPDKTSNQHFGSVLEWLPDATLLMSIGDGGNPPAKVGGILAREQAQRLDTPHGTVLRLKDDGTPPNDNPFVGKQGALPEIWSYGHRNIQGIARDPKTGNVWTTEHGPRGGDELNLTTAGKNYGWPLASFGRDYRTAELISQHKSLPGMVDSKVVWVPSTATSGLAFYTGDKFPAWKGSLLSGGLVSGDIRRIELNGETAGKQESIYIGRRVRDVVQGPDGYIYVLTDHDDGELIRIEPR